MQLRNGTWTSRTFSRDCDEIVRLAQRIQQRDGDVDELALKIKRRASELGHELRNQFG